MYIPQTDDVRECFSPMELQLNVAIAGGDSGNAVSSLVNHITNSILPLPSPLSWLHCNATQSWAGTHSILLGSLCCCSFILLFCCSRLLCHWPVALGLDEILTKLTRSALIKRISTESHVPDAGAADAANGAAAIRLTSQLQHQSSLPIFKCEQRTEIYGWASRTAQCATWWAAANIFRSVNE